MSHFSKDDGTTKEMLSLRFSGITRQVLLPQIDEILLFRKYKRLDGEAGNGVYERGDRTRRILFGAFVKYFKFKVMVDTLSDGEVGVRVLRATSGFSGGVIGVNQVTEEMIQISNALKTL